MQSYSTFKVTRKKLDKVEAGKRYSTMKRYPTSKVRETPVRQ